MEKLEGIFSKYGKEVENCECDLDTLIKIKHKLAAEEEKLEKQFRVLKKVEDLQRQVRINEENYKKLSEDTKDNK